MINIIRVFIWTVFLSSLGYIAYAATFGEVLKPFGTGKFGEEGPTTTSTVIPGHYRKHIIGGGLVKLEKEYIETEDGEVILSLQYKLNKEAIK